MKELNLRSEVKVKLTEKGIQILKELHEDISKLAPGVGDFELPYVDDEGYTTWPLWNLMHTFGKYMYIGESMLPFEENIRIPEKSLVDKSDRNEKSR